MKLLTTMFQSSTLTTTSWGLPHWISKIVIITDLSDHCPHLCCYTYASTTLFGLLQVFFVYLHLLVGLRICQLYLLQKIYPTPQKNWVSWVWHLATSNSEIWGVWSTHLLLLLLGSLLSRIVVVVVVVVSVLGSIYGSC